MLNPTFSSLILEFLSGEIVFFRPGDDLRRGDAGSGDDKDSLGSGDGDEA